jgi:hypothetical protein
MRLAHLAVTVVAVLAIASACGSTPPATTTTTSTSTTTSSTLPGAGSSSGELREVLGGGISCDGVSLAGSDGGVVGSVTLDRSGSSMDVTVDVDSGAAVTAYSIEAFEVPCDMSSDVYATGQLLTTDGAGHGTTTFTVGYPYTTGSGAVGDGAGTDVLAIVLDVGLSECGCGDTYVARVPAPS